MVRGMYMAAMGMLNDMYRLDRVSNDLANVDTVGYKQDREAFRTYLEGLMVMQSGWKSQIIGKLEGAVVLDEVRPVMTQGTLEYTGNKFDLAINGRGFFRIEKNGRILYTRAGNFKLSPEGYLITPDGGYLLDENGKRIKINRDVTITDDGRIIDKSGNIITRIARYDFDNPEKLQKVGYTYFKVTPESGDPKKTVSGIMVGYIERSNVNALRGMVEMIKALRHFEISQRVITSADELLGRLFNNVATLR